MRMLELAFALCVLAGVSLALQWDGNATSSVPYDGGSLQPACSGSSPIDLSATISHALAVHAVLKQGGAEPAEFSSGTADLTLNLGTNGMISYVLTTSSLNANQNAQPSPSSANLVFNGAEYNVINGIYNNAKCLNKNPAKGATDRGIHYINYVYGNSECSHAMSSADAVTVNTFYRSGLDNGVCMSSALQGMGKAYMYCKGGAIRVNGANAGTLSSASQTLNTQVTLTDGMSTIPVSVTYQCYFIIEKYLNDGNAQELKNIIFRMPSGLPITQTVNVQIPTVKPPQINLVPTILLNGTYYRTGQTIRVDKPSTAFSISFFVNRTDSIAQKGVPYINWSLASGIPALDTLAGTYPDWHLVPELYPGTAVQIPDTRSPMAITVCRPGGPTTDSVTLAVNPGSSILESDYGDNAITIMFECTSSAIVQPMCTFVPYGIVAYPGKTVMTNMSCRDSGTGEGLNCPDIRGTVQIYHSSDRYADYESLAWKYDGAGNATNQAYVTAKASPSPDEPPFSDTVTVRFPATPTYEKFECPFDVVWRRSDCKYYM